jgi:hypothetical protein
MRIADEPLSYGRVISCEGEVEVQSCGYVGGSIYASISGAEVPTRLELNLQDNLGVIDGDLLASSYVK